MEEETKKKVTQSAMKAAAKYKKKTYDSMEIRVAKGEREKIADHAARKGLSVNAYVRQVVYTDMGIVDPLNAPNPAKKLKADKTPVQAEKAENEANNGVSEEPMEIIVPDDIPEEYHAQYKRMRRRYAKAEKKYADLGYPMPPFDFWQLKEKDDRQMERFEMMILAGEVSREECEKRDLL